MNEPIYPEPPAGSLATLEVTDDGVIVNLPPCGWRGWRKPLAQLGCLTLPLLFALCMAGPILLRDRLEQAAPALVACGVPATCWFIGMLWLGTRIVYAYRRHRLTVCETHLTVAIEGPLHGSERQWQPGDITLVRAQEGLRILNARYRETRLFPDRRAEEVIWVAGVVRQALGANDGGPPGPGEMRVSFIVSDASRMPGFLHARPGEMRLRDAFAEMPPRRFLADRGDELRRWWRDWLHSRGPVLLGNEDVTCRVQEDGSTCLLIAPSGGGESYTIECDDPEALPRALERFWREDSTAE